MKIQKELEELLEQGVISEDTAERIRTYYQERSKRTQNWLPLLFGILGALLAGLGIILIIAHNWAELPRYTRVGFSFLPLIGTQVAGAILLHRGLKGALQREITGILLFFAVGATLALVSQTYQLQGELSDFLFIWMLLTFPIPYILRSHSSSLLYIAGIAYYAVRTSFDFMEDPTSYYGVLFLLILPYLLLLYRRTPKSNFAAFHNWFVPLSTSIGLIFMEDPGPNEWGSLAFFSMMGLHYSIGQRPLFNGQKAVRNGYRRIGQLGTLAFLFMMSFEFHWDSYWTGTIQLLGYDRAIAVCAVLLFLAATILFALRWRRHSIQTLDPLEGVFLLYPILFLSASIDPMIPYIASNLLVLALGIHRMIEGIREQRLATVNLGALILTILILLRFFEVDISFLAKGLSFLGLGALFFILNHRILQKRRAHGG